MMGDCQILTKAKDNMEILNHGKSLQNFGETVYAYKCRGCGHSVKLKMSEFRHNNCFYTDAPEAIGGKCHNCNRTVYYWLKDSEEYDFITIKPPTFKEIAKPLFILVSILFGVIAAVLYFSSK